MIKQLRLKDYILIDELVANFDSGLNIITGETGAGKSIIISAIDLVFASRVSKEVIKSGKEKAIIELVIENNFHNLTEFFEENGIDDLGYEIVLSKEITQNSVRTRINGTLVNTDILKHFRTLFIDIHSQHQTYTFMQPKYHIVLLDSYGKNVYGAILQEYKTLYAEYLSILNQLNDAKNSLNATDSEIEFLKFQINEIETAEIKSDKEDEELIKELEILENTEKLKELTGTSYWALNGDDGSITDALNKIKQNVSKAVSYDNRLQEIEKCLIDALEILKEVGSDLNNYSQNLENDTERLNQIQERLYLLDKLKRKYGGTLENVLKNLEEFSQKLSKIQYGCENIDELETKLTENHKHLMQKAVEIRTHRKQFADVLSVQIQDKLEFLELPKSRFKINIIDKDLDINGIDDVEFLISTNISEELKPLAKVASGGEISRVMLAIKAIFAENDNINTVVFDEIDTGISGRACQSVAEEIQTLSKYHQIILITHQPIIASKATKHFYVRKSQIDETKVEVFVLNEENRIKALAELAGGEINQQSIEFAKSLVSIQ